MGGMMGMGGAGGSATGQPGGGPMGMAGMDLGLYNFPIIGSLFQNPNETHKQTQFSQAGRAYSAYRPELAQARMNALGNRLQSYQGANNVLAAMMGGRGGFGQNQFMSNPMGPSMLNQGQSKNPSSSGMPQQGPLGMLGGQGGGGPFDMLGGMGGGGSGMLGGFGGM
jgi:hypothetical protein